MVPVFSNGHMTGHAIVDDEDAWVLDHRWTLCGKRGTKGYAGRTGGVLMHRAIMGLAKGDQRRIDHRDRNTLNNQRSNLRIATRAQNAQNLEPRLGASSSFRGVGFQRNRGCWQAYGCVGQRQVHLGFYDSEKAAAAAARKWRLTNMPYATD